MEKQFSKLREQIIYKPSIKPFYPNVVIPSEDLKDAMGFASEMSFGKGFTRTSRSGGQQKRNPSSVFQDVFRGKTAELALYHYLKNRGIILTKPNFEVFGQGKWDHGDFAFENIRISVKSTKSNGNLMLLEKRDWDGLGQYRPDVKKSGIDISKIDRFKLHYGLTLQEKTDLGLFDIHVLARMDKDISNMIEQEIKGPNNFSSDQVLEVMNRKRPFYEITGWVSYENVKAVIRDNQMIRQGECLGSERTVVDADNYYIQAKDMDSPKSLTDALRVIQAYYLRRAG